MSLWYTVSPSSALYTSWRPAGRLAASCPTSLNWTILHMIRHMNHRSCLRSCSHRHHLVADRHHYHHHRAYLPAADGSLVRQRTTNHDCKFHNKSRGVNNMRALRLYYYSPLFCSTSHVFCSHQEQTRSLKGRTFGNCWSNIFKCWMPLLSANQQHQCSTCSTG